MGLPSPGPTGGPVKCVGSLPMGWMLSKVPGLWLLAQLLLASGALRQDVLFLLQCLAQPPPVLPPQSCWRRGAAAARLFMCLLDEHQPGSGYYRCCQQGSDGAVGWSGTLAAPGCGAAGAEEGRSKDHHSPPQPCPCNLHPHGNTQGALGKAGTQEAVLTLWCPSKHDTMY